MSADAGRTPLSSARDGKAQKPIGLIVPVALKEVMESLVPEFVSTSDDRVDIAHKLNPDVPKHIGSGAPWDIAITNPCHVEEVLAVGLAASGSHRRFARAPLAFAVRGTASGPVHHSRDAIVRTLCSARRIAITDLGTSGEKFRMLANELGILDKLRGRIRAMEGGEPMRALLAGDVDMAALPLTNIAPVLGVHAAALCPFALDVHIDFSLCLAPNASLSSHRFADWLLDSARDARLAKLGARRFSGEQSS